MKKSVLCLVAFINILFLDVSGQRVRGCFLSYGSASADYQKVNSSGNTQLDQFIRTDLNVLRQFFGVNPNAYYYIDSDGPNAYFDAQNNTINIGFNLLNKEFISHHNLTTVPIIVAHEFGHCVDNEYRATGLSGITSELFADFMAGIFLRFRSGLAWTDIYGTLNTFFSMGDNLEFTDPNHHGTNEQRLNTIRSGFNWYNAHAGSTVTNMVEAAKNYLGVSRNARTHNDDNTASDGSRASGTSSSNHTSYEIKQNLDIVTFNVRSNTYNGESTYDYKVKIYNKNDFDVSVKVGRLSYGHFENCNSSINNFVKDGEFDSQTVQIGANSNETIEFSITLRENPPYGCSGVKPYQQAKILSAESN